MTLRYDLRINQGETYQVAIPVLDEDGDPVSLSGVTAKAQARSLDDDSLLHEWTVANSGLAFDEHKVVVKVPAATSSAWTWRIGRYDLELTDGSSNVTRLVEGYVLVKPEVVRP
jgi:hypothetical protein